MVAVSPVGRVRSEGAVEKTISVEEVRREIEGLERDIQSVSKVQSARDALQTHKAKLEKQLLSLTKDERKALAEQITGEAPDGLKARIVSQSEYDSALVGKVSDPRAEALMQGAVGLGVKLEPGEIVVIRKGSGVDQGVSQSLTAKFADQLKKLGPELVVVASRGSIAGGPSGPKGELPPAGTRLRKEYDPDGKGKREFVCESVDEGHGLKLKPIKGEQGKFISGNPHVRFDSLSGAARAITGYPTRGPRFWEIVPAGSNGKRMAEPAKPAEKESSKRPG